jgi:hypothetical protein
VGVWYLTPPSILLQFNIQGRNYQNIKKTRKRTKQNTQRERERERERGRGLGGWRRRTGSQLN